MKILASKHKLSELSRTFKIRNDVKKPDMNRDRSFTFTLQLLVLALVIYRWYLPFIDNCAKLCKAKP